MQKTSSVEVMGLTGGKHIVEVPSKKKTLRYEKGKACAARRILLQIHGIDRHRRLPCAIEAEKHNGYAQGDDDRFVSGKREGWYVFGGLSVGAER
jgi:hypothetical protein